MRPVFLRPALATAILALLGGSCASAGKPMPDVAAEINATLDTTPARFLPNDTLEIKFANDPNYNQSVRVDSNGNVSLLFVGNMNVAGKRPDQVREDLERAYKAKLTAPDLSVNLVQLQPTGDTISNRAIHVMGEVRNPGSFAYLGQQMTLLDGIAHAGGPLKATALLKNILLVRWLPDKNNWKAWHIDARYDHWDTARQILLQANDLVFIPNTPIDDVNIWVDQYIRQMIPFPYLIPTTLLFPSTSTGR
jgi:polysaccharide export outer membrane protein